MAKAPKNPKQNAQDSAQAVKIRVIAKKDGFRRAGIVHSGTKIYEPGELTDQQIAVLKDEPLLVVDELEVEPAQTTTVENAGDNDNGQVNKGQDDETNKKTGNQ